MNAETGRGPKPRSSHLGLVPSTFEERGIAVPFTTPVLAQTRVRLDDRERLEVLIPGFAGGKGTYILPWKGIPEMVTMTVHDRTLHEEITESKVSSPHDMRLAALKVARSGLAGAEAAKAAQKALNAEMEQRTLVNFRLMMMALELSGLGMGEFRQAGIDSDAGQEIAKRGLVTLGWKIGITGEECYQRIQELSELLTPIGFAEEIPPGRTREVLASLASLRYSLRRWARGNPTDDAPLTEFASEVAHHTLDVTEGVIQDIDKTLSDYRALLAEWDKRHEGFRRAVGRLSWLLDGWEYVIAVWQEAGKGTLSDQARALSEILRVLPLLPKEESNGEDHGKAAALRTNQVKTVKLHEDWRTGEMDMELILRIESRRAKVA